MEWVVLLVIGLAAGALGSLVGLGGGIIIVPSLIYFGSYTGIIPEASPQVIVGTSLVVMIFTGLSSTLSYMKHKTIDYKSGWIFFIGSGPGSLLGAWINKSLNLHSFSLYFGLFMVFVSVLLMVKKYFKPVKHNPNAGIQKTYTDPQGNIHTYGFSPFVGILISFAVGLLSGLFGIGGGSLMVPAMILIFLFPAHVAIATSMFMVFLSSITSSIAHISMGNIDWIFASALIPGAWVGAKLGVYLNTKFSSKTLVNLLRIILIIAGIRLILQGLAG
ncbi:sulfite exporter TauE/SafE family protein [Falsibacillus pallidus]|uniref:sulfite exporter TauE/SafE family protein n=1 Tax=Falsibacillus pallidus TaxID=493781 RepID=UPI003D9566B0